MPDLTGGSQQEAVDAQRQAIRDGRSTPEQTEAYIKSLEREAVEMLADVEADRDRWQRSAGLQGKTCQAYAVENKALRKRLAGDDERSAG